MCLQDPVIFSGSIRENLDPFGSAAGDAALWQVLEQASVAPAVRDLQVRLQPCQILLFNFCNLCCSFCRFQFCIAHTHAAC